MDSKRWIGMVLAIEEKTKAGKMLEKQSKEEHKTDNRACFVLVAEKRWKEKEEIYQGR